MTISCDSCQFTIISGWQAVQIVSWMYMQEIPVHQEVKQDFGLLGRWPDAQVSPEMAECYLDDFRALTLILTNLLH
jgi:hypothetical protein